ncbi:MAG TPA: uroporphyrinogen decarboxylase family protein [Bryobacteraceae bacterium]|nr:uroporphyrinogen decarboxylase family protein [Bryobacteraceae bacterium]
MKKNPRELYDERLGRYVAAMRNGTPDRVPIRPFAAEFTATYAGLTCQEVTHDYRKAFDAVLRCCADFDWDAVVPNMVYVWTGLTQAMGLRYYAIPGIDIAADVGFQYREPSENEAFMRREEYDELIADPTRFLYEVWFPRVSAEAVQRGCPVTYRNNLAFVKGGMAMLDYFHAFGPQLARMRDECGTPSSISGMLKAPLDILADKLRGYVGLVYDLMEIPDKVLAACRALQPHLQWIALSGLDAERKLPIPIWMHRGCVPFISHQLFDTIYWPTLRPIIEAIWAQGNQVLLYAEGDWTAHLDSFAQLPEGSVIFHIDRTDYKAAGRSLGGKFCLSGGVPNFLLATGTQEAVKARCKELIDELAPRGGYIMDASAILQNDASIDNIRAMTNFTRDYGVYGPSTRTPQRPAPPPPPGDPGAETATKPGACFPWERKVAEIPPIPGDSALAKKVWEDVDSLGYVFIWHVLLGY